MTLVRNKDGIESVIKNLDGKLSEAIMHAMTNGPELEKKVSHDRNILFNRRGIEAFLFGMLPSFSYLPLKNFSRFIELQKNFDCGELGRVCAWLDVH